MLPINKQLALRTNGRKLDAANLDGCRNTVASQAIGADGSTLVCAGQAVGLWAASCADGCAEETRGRHDERWLRRRPVSVPCCCRLDICVPVFNCEPSLRSAPYLLSCCIGRCFSVVVVFFLSRLGFSCCAEPPAAVGRCVCGSTGALATSRAVCCRRYRR